MSPNKETKPNNGSSSISNETMDRLVDGELSRESYREVIARLDEEPDGWKRVAIGFLEAQAFAQELRSFCTEGQGTGAANPPQPTLTVPVETKTISQSVQKTFEELEQNDQSVSNQIRPNWINWPLGLLSSAAAVGIVIVSSMYYQSDSDFALSPNSPAINKFENGLSSNTDQAEFNDADGHIQFVANSTGAHTKPVDVPVYSADRYRPLHSSEVDQVVSQLEKNGRPVRRERQVVPVRSHNNQTIWVPIEQVDIGRADFADYQ